MPGTVHGKGDPFASTHWSVVLTAARDDENTAAAEAALATLCQAYWAPLYTYVRSRGHDTHDAQDLTQGFFAHLVGQRLYARADPDKGKFRSFLLAAMKNFLVDAGRHAQALKRGGAQAELPLVETLVREAEDFYQRQSRAPGPDAQADRTFDLAWAQATVDAALAQLARAYLSEGKSALFAALKPFVTGGAGSLPAHGELAAALGMPASTVRSHVTRLRARYREALHAEVRRTVPSEVDVQEEIHALIRVLTGG